MHRSYREVIQREWGTDLEKNIATSLSKEREEVVTWIEVWNSDQVPKVSDDSMEIATRSFFSCVSSIPLCSFSIFFCTWYPRGFLSRQVSRKVLILINV